MTKIIEKKLVEYPYLPEPLRIITFDNGHKLVLAKKESPMVNISTWVKTGSINENADNNGVSHFLEHLMFKGTHKYKAGEFDCTLERRGGIINAATWKDYTFYYVTIPKKHLELALHMHADMMVDPILPDDEIGQTFNPNGAVPKDGRERCVVIEEIRMGQDRSWRKVYDALNDKMYEKHPYKRNVIGTKEIIAKIPRDDIMAYYHVDLMNPTVLVGVFIGAMMSFLFCGLTMNAVGRAAQKMVAEVRRQFREIKGILTKEAVPDYARCVEISTKGAQREMLLPSLIAIIVPVVVGLCLGVAGVMGLLIGGLGSGFVLAIFMANSGGAWDNAKKYVEEGNLGGKNSDSHKATVVGDTVGDPFKDTSGPSLNILIKLMSMVSIVMAGLTVWMH